MSYRKTITSMDEIPSLPPEPSDWGPPRLQRWRTNKLKVSQPVLAAYVGVSPATIKAWEQGAKIPTGASRRLLDIIAKDPERVMGLIRKASQLAGKG